jgi:uncharacterized protein (DUF2141 family)
MKKLSHVIIWVLFALIFFTAAQSAPTNTAKKKITSKKPEVSVEVTGFRNNKGVLKLSLFNSAEGFPGQHEIAFKKVAVEVVSATVTAYFKDIEPGEYAISILHDENDNHKLDTGIFGIPAEGVGASNNPKGGPPKYDDVKFAVGKDDVKLHIKIVYIL